MNNKNIILLLLLILIWGASWPINKVGLFYTSPTNFNELRFLFGTISMFLVVLFTKNFIVPHLKDLPLIFTMSIFQIGLTMNLSNYGLSLIGAGKATFIIFTTSLWIIPLTALIKKRFPWQGAVSLLLSILGLLLLLNPFQANWLHGKAWVGDVFLLGAALSWSIGILSARNMKWYHTPLQLLPWQLLLSTVATILLAYFQGISFFPKTMNLPLVGSLFYSGFVAIGLGYWIMIVASKKLNSSLVSCALIFVPIISLIISHIFLHEEITARLLVAISLLIGGALVHIYVEGLLEKKR
jgi:drug/metabolite transporter (DMT)-like permease